MFFGEVFGARDTICRIKVICKCKLQNGTIVDIDYDTKKNIGKTNRVFVPNNNRHTLKEKQLLFFSVKENERDIREGDDLYILDEKLNYSAMPLIVSTMKSLDSLLNEPFYKIHYKDKKTVFAKVQDKIYGSFVISNTVDHFKLTTPSNQQKVSCWDTNEFTVIKDDNLGMSYVTDIPKKSSLEFDISTPIQLKNWLRRKIKENSSGKFLEAIKTLEPFIENSDKYSNNDLEQQKWAKIKEVFSTIQLEYEELEEFLSVPIINEKFKSDIQRYKDEIVENRSAEITKEVEHQQALQDEIMDDLDKGLELKKQNIQEEIFKHSKIKKRELKKLDDKISIAMQELESIINNKGKELETKEILDAVVNRFETNRDEIIENLLMYQSFLPNSRTTSALPIQSSKTLYFDSTVEIPTTKEFVKNIKKNYTNHSIDIGATEIFGMIASLSLYKGLFVPSLYWSRLYSNAHPLYEHFNITVDPSWKGIRNLWENYLENIVSLANANLSNTFIIHFEGINNSVPEVWMKAVHSLVTFENVRVPVEGFPIWPKNIQFFFSPAEHEHAFELNEQILNLWPAITDKEIEGSDIPDFLNDKKIALNCEINSIRERNESEDNDIVQKLLWSFPQSFQTQKKNLV